MKRMVLSKKPVSISGDVYVKRLYTRFCIGAIHSPCLIFSHIYPFHETNSQEYRDSLR